MTDRFTKVTGDRATRLEARLRQELVAGHVLWPLRQALRVVGAAGGQVLLVETADAAHPFAIVRLSWAVPGLFRDADPSKPETEFLGTLPEMDMEGAG